MRTKVKKIAIVVILLLLVVACQKKVDSHQKEIDIFLGKADNKSILIGEREKNVDLAYESLRKSTNDSVTRVLLLKVASSYYDLDNSGKYIATTRTFYKRAIQAKDTTHLATALYYMGDYHEMKAQFDSAFYYYNQSEKIYKKLGDTENTGRMTLFKAGILYDSGNFTEAEIQGISALRIVSVTKNTRLVYESYILIALCLKELNDYEMALKYFDLALLQLDKLETEDYPKNKILNSRASCYNNIGNIYEKSSNHEKAIVLYLKGLETKGLKSERPELYAMLLANLGYAKMNLGRMQGVEKLMIQSLYIRESLQILPGIVSSKLMLGEFHLLEKDTAKALVELRETYLLATKIKSSPDILKSLKLLMENDEANEDYYKKVFFRVSDSVHKVERITRNKFARIAYETRQIEEQNQLLSKRNIYILWMGSALILAGLVSFFIFRLKGRNKELLYIRDQQEANEKIYQLMLTQQSETEAARKEERNRIAMELHDGIVNSIFTTRFNLSELDSNATEKKEQLIAELKKTEEEIRRVSHDLQQNLLFEDQNLPEIISNLVVSQQNEFGTVFDLTIDKYIDWSAVSTQNKIHLYRIIQEAIQNVNKYANAKKCFVMLLRTGNNITVRIWDDGIGFDMKSSKNGIGLRNIGERVKALNGEYKMTSEKGKGTKIEIVFLKHNG